MKEYIQTFKELSILFRAGVPCYMEMNGPRETYATTAGRVVNVAGPVGEWVRVEHWSKFNVLFGSARFYRYKEPVMQQDIDTTYETAKIEMSSAYGKIYAAILEEKNAEIARLQRRVTELEETLREMA